LLRSSMKLTRSFFFAIHRNATMYYKLGEM